MKKTTTSLIFLFTFSGFLVYGQITNYVMDNSLDQVNSCSGFFFDSGGSSDGYGPNEDFTTTFCPAGNGGTHVQLVFSSTAIGPGDDLCFYDGPDTSAPLLTCSSDFTAGAAFIIQATAPNASGCLTVTFHSDAIGQGDGWSADINCVAACQIIYSIIDSSDPAIVPLDTGYIDICPGDRVFLTGRGEYPQDGMVYNHSDLTSEFEWNFGDGTTSRGPDVSHVFNEPGGYTIELIITDQFGCRNTNYIKQRVRVAPKPEFNIGDYDDQVCAGDTVNLNAMVNAMDADHTVSVTPAVGTFQTGGIRSDSLPLPDGNGASYSTSISFNGFAPGQVLTDITDLVGIFVNMEHSWMRDLEISIECPNGNNVMLHNHPGQIGGEVFLGVPYENDEALPVPIPGQGYTYGWAVNPDYDYTWIEYANWFAPSTLPAGTYQSYQPLSNLIGCPLNGEWTITVTDLWSIDNGNIFSWSIEFDKELFPDLETFELELTDWHWNNHPSIFYQEEDSIAAIPFNAGEVAYTFEVEDEFGCLWDTTVNIEVLPPTHPDCYTCSGLLADFPDTVICPESSVALDVSTVLSSSDITFESYDDYPIGAGNHPPAFPYLSTINVNSVNPLIITDPASDIVSVCLDLETDFDSDISLYLVTPTGQLFMLSTNNGGSGDNYTQTCFTPTAVTPITAGSPPFTGDFRPEGNWANLTGNPINGAWSLRVSDQFGVNALGRLNWWSITFQTDNSVTYSWSPPTGLSCTDCPDPVASPDDDITYTVTANDIYGCSAMEEIQISVQSDYFAPDIQLVDIPGGTVVATWNDVNPGTQYEVNVNNTGWVPSNNGNLSHMINGLNFGNTITVQVRSIVLVSICAVGIGSSSITYSYCTMDAVITTSEPFEVSCFGICDAAVSITELNGTAPYTYEVTNNTLGIMFTQPNGQLTMLCPGDYTVIVTDADDCKDTLEFEVLDKLPISIIATEYMPASCFGMSNGCATVQAIGGAGGFTYLWDDANASISDTVCGLPQGQYMVVATDQDGCTATATVLITQPDELDLQITATDANCLGGNDGTATATVTGGTQPYNYTWSGGSTPNDQTATGLVAGIYSVLVEDANGCQVSGDVTVGEPSDGLILTLTPFSGCNALNENRVESQVTGGTPPYQYAWTPTGETTPDIAGLPNGNFTLVVTDALGCTITETVFVQDLPDIEIELAFSPPTCHDGMDGAMAVNQVSGGTGMGYTYEWNTGDTDDFANGLLGGLVYTVTVTDSQGCEGVEGRSMPNPPPLEPVATITDATCNGYADGRVAITDVQNANGGVNFQWDDAAGNQTTPSAFNLAAGDYSVVITDSEGCSFSTVYTIGQPEPITADYVVVENECFGESQASIDPDVSGGTPGYAFQWSNGTTAAKLTAIPSGMYYVTITDANQCVKEDSVFVDQPDEVDIQVVVSDVSCFGGMDGSLTIEATGGTPPYRYSLDNNTYVGSSTLIALVAGDYSLFVQDANDCVYSQDAIINEPPELSVDIISNGENVDELTIFSGDRVLFDADITNGMGQVMYNWTAAWCGSLVCSADTTTDCNMDINCAFPIATPDFTNDYFLIIEDENGCTTEDHVQVHVRKIRVVEVPTGFTPNGDNNNDLLSVHGRSGTMIHLFQVFDRWGELLYQDVELPINDTSRGWDGTFKGKDMPPGVYVWYVEAEYADGMKDSFKGETTLIR